MPGSNVKAALTPGLSLIFNNPLSTDSFKKLFFKASSIYAFTRCSDILRSFLFIL